ncbi:aminopeptidase [Paenibacillus sp. CGMCC 1.16610]|uniref:Aminopeptidase n=1 Tax=Paenibacillus anseongense TaxID=2682845 RepID=A0ABW9UJE0_9BACL|nr:MULTISPECIES: aminopeptidase [Paenibacillus]MBA2941451.1 aminopeptidase [Paenibacillus sp. CGMCC 1.16610]MVQ40269.1 aminopeptidase [Paenibacillus anseongense]
MTKHHDQLVKYASLAIQLGVNVQPGQTLVIFAPLVSVDFVRLLVKRAYEIGAKLVYVEWADSEITRMKYELAPFEALLEYPMWQAKGYEELASQNAAFLYVSANNPDLMNGIDPKRLQTASKTSSSATQGLTMARLTNKVSWTIVAVPTPAWADKVFPLLPEEERVDALWSAIFQATRVQKDDPIEEWRNHARTLLTKSDLLNEKQYKALHYRAEGTDITVELPQDHLWVSAGSNNQQGDRFIANMPTEEVFTSPLRTGVNGTVRSTKPLSYNGVLIENFSLTFEEGRIVDFAAEKGEEMLRTLVEMDEGSHYLGEIALVPHRSPISDMNIIFYNTLYDENASCHFAIGRGFPFCLKDGVTMSGEELLKRGLNESLTHVDFMMGSADMDIDGIKMSGEVEPVFRKGDWVI